ncbi:MAG: hydroxymethylbilane synthase [Candidatus Dadabacteria bacterium]|nr:hydroxymethylbilane synthase [Candidatus Dadabacteria bacterium]
MRQALKIGTRGSTLAKWQSAFIARLIEPRFPDLQISSTIIKTTGDKILNAPFAQIGKGIFVKEIEEALLDGSIDIAVHSMKDMPTDLPEGLKIGAVAKRHSPYDALCTANGTPFAELPQGAKVGTSSIRRQAQLLHSRPDLQITPLRGNVDTRLKKLHTEGLEAVVLAQAGLERMGLSENITEVFTPDVMVPAPGQGTIAIESRVDDNEVDAILAEINDAETLVASETERAFLEWLGGGCQVPVGCHAQIDGDSINMLAIIASPDGKELIREEISGSVTDHRAIGTELADSLLGKGGREILEKLIREGG